jgi:heme/copper-type cytochrome/quinol oxidase subunit 2
MGGGMMMHPVALPQNATRPIVRQLGATQRGDYTLSCLTYCGYGHPYMEIDGGIVIT